MVGGTGRSARAFKIVIWHGYLLGGTGSNVYSRALAREWAGAGHDVTVICQEPEPERYDLAGARVVRPELPGGVLPVFVLDRYEGLEPRLLHELGARERDAYVEANAATLRAELPADVVLTNHALLGGAVGAAAGHPFGVKVHGSELEYSMRQSRELAAWGAAALAQARAVLVGSAHVRRALEEVVGRVERVHEVPPGVDVDAFRPRPRAEALAALLDEARGDPANPGNAEERLPDDDVAVRLESFFARTGPTVLYVGKLIPQKGVTLLLEALAGVDARAAIVGFGPQRGELERLAPPGTLFTGALEHRHLVHLLPLVDVVVVPSVFPEAFGMVAAEAAAAGTPPLVARHSGLAEVAAGIAAEYPPRRRDLTAFDPGVAADLGARLRELLELPAEERARLGASARRAALERWSWAGVARRLLALLH